ncbi:MAG: hypothetical protein ACRDHK_11800, partial [Actinomycetota bacterium]
MWRRMRVLPVLLAAVVTLGPGARALAAKLSESRIYIEYNSSAKDLGFHVSLDGEDWTSLKIINPAGVTVFEVTGRGAYNELGMTELFFEGAEPSLDEFPLADLLALFPEGRYQFIGVTVRGGRVSGTGTLTLAVPDGPSVSAEVGDDAVVIRWDPVTGPPEGFPDRKMEIAGYQILVDPFQVTLPATSTQVTLPREFVESLPPGEHPFEVLAIEAGGNQTIT